MNQEIKVGQLWIAKNRKLFPSRSKVCVTGLGATTVESIAIDGDALMDQKFTASDDAFLTWYRRPNWFERTFLLPKEQVVDVPRISKWNERMAQEKEKMNRANARRNTQVYTGSHSFEPKHRQPRSLRDADKEDIVKYPVSPNEAYRQDDLLNPLNIASPLSPLNPFGVFQDNEPAAPSQDWSPPTQDNSPSYEAPYDPPSSSDSTSYDSGDSSSYDSGSSSFD